MSKFEDELHCVAFYLEVKLKEKFGSTYAHHHGPIDGGMLIAFDAPDRAHDDELRRDILDYLRTLFSPDIFPFVQVELGNDGRNTVYVMSPLLTKSIHPTDQEAYRRATAKVAGMGTKMKKAES